MDFFLFVCLPSVESLLSNSLALIESITMFDLCDLFHERKVCGRSFVIHMYTYMHTYIYIQGKRERERVRFSV